MTQRHKIPFWPVALFHAEAAALSLYRLDRKAGPAHVRAIANVFAKRLDAALYSKGATPDQIRQAVRYFREHVPDEWGKLKKT